MDVGRQSAGIIQRANTNEPYEFANAARQDQVIAPDSDLAVRAAAYSLIRTTWGWHVNIRDISVEKLHPLRFDQGIDREGRTRLALAPTAVAAMHYQWLRRHSEANVTTGTTPIVKLSLL